MQNHHTRAAAAAPLLFAFALALGGCATGGGGATSSAFVDPAKYSLYNCKQLDDARKTVFEKVSELQGLMAKAEQSTGGSLISGIAYQTDYLSARDNLALIDEERARNRCGDVVAKPDASRPPAAKTRRKLSPSG